MRSDTGLPFDASDSTGRPLAIEKTAAFSHSGYERNHVFLNLAGSQFLDASVVSGADDPADGRSCALLDYDRDGYTDILVVNANAPFTRLWRNGFGERKTAGPANRVVALRFVGSQRGSDPAPGKTSRDGYGAKAWLHLADGRSLLREFRCGEGMASQNSTTMLVGIAGHAQVGQLRVAWPTGVQHETASVPAGSLVTAYEDPGQSPNGTPFVVEPYAPAPLLADDGPSAAPARAPHVSPLAAATALRAGSDATLTLVTTTATWCPTCKGELPQLAALRHAFDESELALVGVPADPADTRAQLEAYVAEHRPAYRMALELSPSQTRAVTAVGQDLTGAAKAFPVSLVLDRRGRVVWSAAGVPTVSQLRKLLNEIES